MKQLIISSLLLLMAACNVDKADLLVNKEVVILGHSIKGEVYDCRGAVRGFEEGTAISFFASGGIDCEGDVLTLKGNQWKGNVSYQWKKNQLPAEVCAFYPTLPKDAKLLYTEDGQLTDVLVAQNSYTHGDPIGLSFEHLFTRVQFQVDNRLNQVVKEFTVEVPLQISSLNPYTGHIETENLNNPLRTTYMPDVSGIYNVLLPAGNSQTIQLIIQTEDGRCLQNAVANIKCDRNSSYICKVKDKTCSIGIETAADYIAFTKLINNEPCPGRSLSEFGVTVNGVTTYYLNNDIQFTNDEKMQIRPIGIDGFNDVFDGQGYTLTNMSLQGDNTIQYSGAFANLNERGIIKNLRIRNCQNSLTRNNGYMGILCGISYGLINNCSIENCELVTKGAFVGGLVAYNLGTIMNCNIDGLTLTIHEDKSNASPIMYGGITSINHTEGIIINCCVSHLYATKGGKNTLKSSCISEKNDNIINNCLINQAPSKFYPFCRECTKFCEYCFYPASLNEMAGKTKGMTVQEQKAHRVEPFYNNNQSRQNTVNALNRWIDTEGAKNYPGIKFKRWKVYTNNTMGFENP